MKVAFQSIFHRFFYNFAATVVQKLVNHCAVVVYDILNFRQKDFPNIIIIGHPQNILNRFVFFINFVIWDYFFYFIKSKAIVCMNGKCKLFILKMDMLNCQLVIFREIVPIDIQVLLLKQNLNVFT
ncbi:hypothetical protein D3C87_702410 [compost metagenome]